MFNKVSMERLMEKIKRIKKDALYFYTFFAICLLLIVLFSQMATAEITYTAKQDITLDVENLSYIAAEGLFRGQIYLQTVVNRLTLTPAKEYIFVSISGLERFKEDNIKLQIQIKKTNEKLRLKEGISALKFNLKNEAGDVGLKNINNDKINYDAIQISNDTVSINYEKIDKNEQNGGITKKIDNSGTDNNSSSKITKRSGNVTFMITINNYDKTKVLLKTGRIACYNFEAQICEILEMAEIHNSKLSVPDGTQSIEFLSTILEGKQFTIKDNAITIEMKNQSFNPVEKISPQKTLFNLFYKFYHKKSQALIKSGIFREEDREISITYPTACDDVYLHLEKHGYEQLDEEISSDNPESLIRKIEMSKKTIKVGFRIRNGKDAVVMIGEQMKKVGDDGKISFDINPDIDGSYYICKDGFEPIKGNISTELIYSLELKSLLLEPPALNKISFSNAYGYKGKIILKDDLNKTYSYEINQNNREFKIFGKRIIPNPFPVNPIIDKIKYIVKEKDRSANVFEIKPLWEEINFSFRIKIKAHGQEVPQRITVYLNNVYPRESNVKQDNMPLTLNVNKDSATIEEKKFIYFPYFDPTISAYVPNDRFFEGKNFSIKKNQTACDLNLDCRRPALCVVVFLSNSLKGIKKQDIIDEKVRDLFRFKSDYTPFYVSWVNYNKTTYGLNDFKNPEKRQIYISDRNTNDTVEVTLNKIIEDIEQKFSNVNVLEGKKVKSDKLRIILDRETVSSNSILLSINGYNYDNKLNVKLIDFDEVLENSVDDLMKKIK